MRSQVFIQTLQVSSSYRKNPKRFPEEINSALQISRKVRQPSPKSPDILEEKEDTNKPVFQRLKDFFTTSFTTLGDAKA